MGKMKTLDLRLAFVVSRISLIVFAVSAVCLAETAFSQTFTGAPAEALGGAGRASSNPLDAHYLNPGAMVFAKGTNFGGTFQEGDISLSTPVNNYAFEITDNDIEKPVNGGVGYAYKRSSFPDHTVYDQDISISLAAHILPTIGFGVQVHRLFEQNSAGPSYTKYNSTLGVLAVPAPWFGLAVVAYDYLGDSDQVLIPTFAIGTNFVILDIMRIRADVVRPELKNPTHAAIYSLGDEFNLGYDFFLRVGGKWDTILTQTYVTVGLGFEGPKLNLGYAYRSNVNVDGDAYHTLETWLTF
jgi:hypothetical protein